MLRKGTLQSRAWLILLLAAAALMIYGRSLGNDFVIWDDDSLVYQNPLTQQMTVKTVWGAFTSYDPELYVPLTIVSFQLERAVFGFTPFFFHLDNLLLHVLNAYLVILVLEKFGLKRTTALIAGLIFAVHPINTEAVAWVSARKDLLATSFSLSALLSYIRFRRDNGNWWFWVSVVLALAAMLSKPVAIVLPAILLLLDWKERGRVSMRDITSKIPFFLLSALILAVGLYGKRGNIAALTPMETLLLAAKSAIFSLRQFFWPADLSSIYLQTDVVSAGLPQFYIPIVLLAAITGVVFLSLRWTRLVAFSALFYGIFLLPAFANFAKDDVYFFSDRYIILSQIGLLFLVGCAADHLLRRREIGRRGWALGIASAPLLLLFGWTAHAHSLLWKDSETLYRDALRTNDRSVEMHYNLAVLEHRRGNRAAALAEYQRTLEIDPRNAKALGNLAVFEKEEGEIDNARKTLRLAMESDPSAPEPHNTLGSILMDRGDVNGAIAEFRTAIALRESFAQAYVNLASALGRKGLYDEGLREYRRAFELSPGLLDGSPEIERALEQLSR